MYVGYLYIQADIEFAISIEADLTRQGPRRIERLRCTLSPTLFRLRLGQQTYTLSFRLLRQSNPPFELLNQYVSILKEIGQILKEIAIFFTKVQCF